MSPPTAPCTEKQISTIPQPTPTAKTSKKKHIRADATAAAMATIQDDDERLLTRIGYKQVDPPPNLK